MGGLIIIISNSTTGAEGVLSSTIKRERGKGRTTGKKVPAILSYRSLELLSVCGIGNELSVLNLEIKLQIASLRETAGFCIYLFQQGGLFPGEV